MNQLAKDLGIELKPFCVRSDEFPSAQICQDMLDWCVTKLAASAFEGVEGTVQEYQYERCYSLDFLEVWGFTDYKETLTFCEVEVEDSGCELLTYQDMLTYLQLTEKDGRLVPNEELKGKVFSIPDISDEETYTLTDEDVEKLKEQYSMYQFNPATGEVNEVTDLNGTSVEPPVSSSEPVSMIKGRVVDGNLERLLEIIIACSEGDYLVWEEDGSAVSDSDWNQLIRDPSHLRCVGVCLDSEYEQITLDKQIKEAENTILEAQQRLDELKKQRGGDYD